MKEEKRRGEVSMENVTPELLLNLLDRSRPKYCMVGGGK